jgi:hypothetical protein
MRRFSVAAAVFAALAVGALLPDARAAEAVQCDASGDVRYTEAGYGLWRWSIDLYGTCREETGAVSDVRITNAPSGPLFYGGPPQDCLAAGRGVEQPFRYLVSVTRTDRATGASTEHRQYWSAVGVGNATPFQIQRVTYYGPSPSVEENPSGAGTFFREIFLACDGDPHTEVAFGFAP